MNNMCCNVPYLNYPFTSHLDGFLKFRAFLHRLDSTTSRCYCQIWWPSEVVAVGAWAPRAVTVGCAWRRVGFDWVWKRIGEVEDVLPTYHSMRILTLGYHVSRISEQGGSRSFGRVV
ncbi:hypothetical protein RchiOBHm_Chr2g0117631 [Rosa chinensis]|uniref:Uncharacterized protein n=1 Tax=Rosa chinensis TaxID=74649 RepID=A0A2P6RRJ5_ROSCH|nr:hypothetical protein RchiOBHm_Chr2g0117631 [Rosa chinensis]